MHWTYVHVVGFVAVETERAQILYTDGSYWGRRDENRYHKRKQELAIHEDT